MREPASSFALKTRFLSIISKMRIRKNVRLSSFMPAELIKPYDCQLNQSPWDVIDFSDETESNFRQFERENNFTEEDGGLGNFNGASTGSGATSLKERAGKEKVVVHVEMDIENEFGLKELGEKIMRCGKITNVDGDDDLIIEKMAATKLTPTARRSRSSRATKGSTSNSNQEEFYYYSGFGPSWRKKRSRANNTINVNIVNSDNVVVIDDGEDDQNNQKNSDTGKAEDDHKVDGNVDDDETENSSRKRKKSVRARSLLSLM